MNAPVTLRRLELSVASGDALDVRQFRVSERLSSLFEVTVVALSPNPDVDLDAAVGGGASFTAHALAGSSRTWGGIVSRMRLVTAEERGLSTYEVTIVPRLWLLTQNIDSRIFQQMSEIDIVVKVLGKWGIAPALKLTSVHKKRKYRVQYAESDYDFVCRMLEDAGVSFHFEDGDGGLVLSDVPQEGPRRAALPFRDNPTASAHEHATALSFERALRPGRVTLRDHDYRKPPSYKLLAEANGAGGIEGQLEHYLYTPGAFLFESERGESTPFSDDKGKYRVDEAEAVKLAERRLHAHRAGAKTVSFKTNAVDVGPGTVLSFSDHPRADIGGGQPYLVTAVESEGRHDGEWTHRCQAGGADAPFFPERKTARPSVTGVESATVVGPPGEEIHTDEFGRVRVHFHWDRESKMDDRSSCWIHVSQPWGGSGYGGLNLPRVGQEVVVGFLGGDPDRPVIVGRVFTNLQRVPYKLPEAKTQTVFRSQSTNGKDGYNEIRYEDQAGSELFRVQAERNYHKVVKNDETAVIHNDRAKEVKRDNKHEVGRDDRHAVGRDREHVVQRDHTEEVGNNRSRTVKNDESILVGNNHDYTVANNEKRFVGNSRTTEIAENEKHKVGGSLSKYIVQSLTKFVGGGETATVLGHRTRTVIGPETVTVRASSTRTVVGADTLTISGLRTKLVHASETRTIGGSRTTAITGSDTVTIQQAASRTVTGAHQESLGATSNVSIKASRTTLVGEADTVTVGKTFSVTVSPPPPKDPAPAGEAAPAGGAAPAKEPDPTSLTMNVDKIELRTKKGALFTMEGDTITLHAMHLVLDGGQDVKVAGQSLLQLTSKGGDVVIHGGPMVKINT
jgi:type VI secretion system secreted protein VgrG